MLKAKENYNKVNLSEQSRNKARIRETGLSLHTKTDRRGVTSLVSLDLTGCDFHGRIPSFRNLTSLELLHVGVNDFMNSSSIFQELSSSNLISLDIGASHQLRKAPATKRRRSDSVFFSEQRRSEGMKDKPKLTDKKFEKKLEFYSIKKKKKIRTRQTKLKAYNLSSLAECLPDLESSKQETPAGRGETCAEETSVNLFFSEIVNLAAARINGMVERLELSQEIRERVYSLFQQILSHRTTLLFNRHIDQIVLCCFYGIAKVSQLSLTFKEIIHGYRKQPNYVSQVIRHVYVGDTRSSLSNVKTGQNHVDIIMFYNEVFLPAVKPLLLELAEVAQTTNQVSETNNHDQGPCSGSPKVSVFPDMSPKKMDALISHGSESSCYAQCVGDTTHEYQSPLKDLTAIDSRLNGNCAIVSGSCGGS